ncbi:MAG: hypothetical protein K8R54_02625 [Bacteroidales bacterium]|nr:hypothetical protein [Bacteroidales bacterium]
MKTIKIFTTVLLMIACFGTFAQDTTHIELDTNNDLKKRSFQITFITPMGTNGLEAGQYTNKLSVNMFAGYAGGLEGIEFGGFSNVINGKVTGAQFAGFTNVVNGGTNGAQFAGFSNIVRDDLTGGQFTGFTNIVAGDVKGIQASGFTNLAKGNLNTAQITGFANVVNGKTDGIQIAGFTNITRKELKGFQLAGFANIAGNNADAVQIAGFSNTAKDTITGLQLSSFINTAKHVKGCQIGFINICDSVENGIPLGFISIVRKGYHKFEIGADESFYANASIKLGVSKFYNIFSFGVKPVSGIILWGPGYGVGSEFKMNNKFNMNIDLISYTILDSEHDWQNEPRETGNWNYEFSFLHKISITLSRQFRKHFTIYGGPSFNAAISNETDNEGTLTGTQIAPWIIYKKTHNETIIEMYPGFRAGIRF